MTHGCPILHTPSPLAYAPGSTVALTGELTGRAAGPEGPWRAPSVWWLLRYTETVTPSSPDAGCALPAADCTVRLAGRLSGSVAVAINVSGSPLRAWMLLSSTVSVAGTLLRSSSPQAAGVASHLGGDNLAFRECQHRTTLRRCGAERELLASEPKSHRASGCDTEAGADHHVTQIVLARGQA